MEGFFHLRRSFLEAVVIGLLATSALFLPPLELGTRANLYLYDLWSRLTGESAPADILLVRLDDPALLTPLAKAAHEQQAKLLITTLPEPPSPLAAAKTLGPVDLPVGATLLRRTDWPHGGHLLYEPDLDGVVRRERPLLDDSAATPSLALFAAKQVDDVADSTSNAEWTADADDTVSPRWIRFYAGHPFPEIAASDLLANPSALQGKIAIAGRSPAERLTPVGSLTTRELLAQALLGYRNGQQVDAGPLGSIMSWCVALALLGLLAVRPFRTRAGTIGFVAAAGFGFVVWAAASFALGTLWLPIVGPVILLLATGSILAAREPVAESVPATDDTLVNARRMAAAIGAKIVPRKYLGLETTAHMRFVRPATWWLQQIPPYAWLTRLMVGAMRVLPKALIRPFLMKFLTTTLGPDRVVFEQGAILVNKHGERFTDELAHPVVDITRQPEGVAYIVFDTRLARKFSAWPYFISTAPGVAFAFFDDYRRARPDIFHSGDSTDALAAAMGFSQQAFAAAIHSANEGRPDDRKLEDGPFYALGPVKVWVTVAHVGLAVNTRLEVLDESGTPIPRLYAAGNAGQGELSVAGHGHSLGWALTTGRLAVRNIAARMQAQHS